MSVWDIWCSGSGLDSALQGSAVSRSMSWHEFEGSGCVCVWGPPDVQTERRALFSQAFVSVQILSTLQTLFLSLFVHFRRSEKFWRAEEKCYTVTYEVWWCFKWRIFLWKCTSVYPYKKKGATVHEGTSKNKTKNMVIPWCFFIFFSQMSVKFEQSTFTKFYTCFG